MAEKPFRVIVVGGSIAGLALAHGLQRLKSCRPLQVIVYEKSNEESRFVQYPIHVAADGRQGLRYLLTEDEYADLVKQSDYGIEHGGITIASQDLKRRFAMRQEEDENLHFVSRADLLRLLVRGVDVQRGVKVLKAIDRGQDGVSVMLKNGTEEAADLVVGADGIGSTLRAQLSPHLTRVPSLPHLTISFKLRPDALILLADPHGINLVLGRKNYSLLLVPMGTAYIYAIATIPVFDQWRSAADWQRRLITLLESDQADTKLVGTIEDAWIYGSDNVWQGGCMDAKLATKRTEGRVVLIGDAAHALPPYGGVGASAALRDAAELCSVLQTHLRLEELDERPAAEAGRTGSLEHSLHQWHAAMMRRALAHLADAKRRMDLSLRSGRGVRLQRLILVLMDVLWPLARIFSLPAQKR